MSLALQSYLDTKDSIKNIEDVIYGKILTQIRVQINLGFFQTVIKFQELINTENGKYNFVQQNTVNVVKRLKEDGFYVPYAEGFYHVYWDNPVGKDYVVGGAKYLESKKALEQ